jgi:hypothetical protein
MNFNLLSVSLFVAALRGEGKELALSLATEIAAYNYLVPAVEPEQEYTEETLTDAVSHLIGLIEKGNVDLTWNVYIPQTVGLVQHYLNTQTEQSNGKTDSEPSDI